MPRTKVHASTKRRKKLHRIKEKDVISKWNFYSFPFWLVLLLATIPIALTTSSPEPECP